MTCHTYGYVRVSTREQNLDRQLDAIKRSGKDFSRSEWKRMMRRMHTGDLLVVKSIDRLRRNLDEITDQWRYITKVRGGGRRGAGHALA